MAEHTETERLDFLLSHSASELDSGSDGYYLRMWLGSCAAEDAGFDTGSGHYIARGESPRACIDNAIDHKLVFIG